MHDSFQGALVERPQHLLEIQWLCDALAVRPVGPEADPLDTAAERGEEQRCAEALLVHRSDALVAVAILGAHGLEVTREGVERQRTTGAIPGETALSRVWMIEYDI